MEPRFLHVDGIISSYSFVVSIHEYYICTFKKPVQLGESYVLVLSIILMSCA